MRKKVMRFEGAEQIHSFLSSYPDEEKLADVFELFHIPEKAIRQVTVKREEKSKLYVIQFYTDNGILSLQEDSMI